MKVSLVQQTMKTHGRSGDIAPPFLTSSFDVGDSASRSGSFIPCERTSGTQYIGSWMVFSRSGQCGEKKNLIPIPGIELWMSITCEKRI
jgi:hypothetical protein